MLAIKAALLEPSDGGLANALVGLAKGETSALCYALRYSLSVSKFPNLNAHLRKSGYVLTLSSEAKFLETIIKISNHELGFGTKIAVEELSAPGNAEKKKSFLAGFLSACAKKNDEFEKESTSLQGRRRSYSAGAEQLKSFPLSIIPRHSKGDDEPLKEPRVVVASRQNMIEPWVSPPNPPHVQSGSPRLHYFPRNTSMTPPAPFYGAHSQIFSPNKEEDHGLGTLSRSTSGSISATADEDSPREGSASARIGGLSSQVKHNGIASSKNQHVEDDLPLSLKAKEVPFLAVSPRERLMSPQRKTLSVASPNVLPPSNSRRIRRFELEEEQGNGQQRGSPGETPGDLNERLARLEVRLDAEFQDISDRFARLEKSLGDLTKLLVLQTKNGVGRKGEESE